MVALARGEPSIAATDAGPTHYVVGRVGVIEAERVPEFMPDRSWEHPEVATAAGAHRPILELDGPAVLPDLSLPANEIGRVDPLDRDVPAHALLRPRPAFDPATPKCPALHCAAASWIVVLVDSSCAASIGWPASSGVFR